MASYESVWWWSEIVLLHNYCPYSVHFGIVRDPSVYLQWSHHVDNVADYKPCCRYVTFNLLEVFVSLWPVLGWVTPFGGVPTSQRFEFGHWTKEIELELWRLVGYSNDVLDVL